MCKGINERVNDNEIHAVLVNLLTTLKSVPFIVQLRTRNGFNINFSARGGCSSDASYHASKLNEMIYLQ